MSLEGHEGELKWMKERFNNKHGEIFIKVSRNLIMRSEFIIHEIF